MVYLWCDGNDPEFRKRKEQYSGNKAHKNATGNVRFWDNEELRYSLRSLEKFAPWINHVYIITDRQVPYWLDTSYEKVTVVDHSEIMPAEAIPCFNSNVIEYYLPYAPGLSEKFLYGNDDMFFCAPCAPEDFFEGDKPIVRLTPHNKIDEIKCRIRNFLSDHGVKKYKDYTNPLLSIILSCELLERKHKNVKIYTIHHNIDAYSKSCYLDTLKTFDAEIQATKTFRFRHKECVHRIIFALDAVYSGKAILKIEPNFEGLSKVFVGMNKQSIFGYFGKEYHIDRVRKVMAQNKPKLFCLNGAENGNQEIKEKAKQFLEEMFPEASKFEKV